MATAEYFEIHVRILKNFACGRFTDTDKLFSQYKNLYPQWRPEDDVKVESKPSK